MRPEIWAESKINQQQRCEAERKLDQRGGYWTILEGRGCEKALTSTVGLVWGDRVVGGSISSWEPIGEVT